MAKQLTIMKRNLPHNDTKKSFFFHNYTNGLRNQDGGRDKYHTTWSYWLGVYLWEFNLTIRHKVN